MSEILTVGKRGRKENVWKAELRINWTNVSCLCIFSLVEVMFKKLEVSDLFVNMFYCCVNNRKTVDLMSCF